MQFQVVCESAGCPTAGRARWITVTPRGEDVVLMGIPLCAVCESPEPMRQLARPTLIDLRSRAVSSVKDA